MMKKKRKIDIRRLKTVSIYLATSIVVLLLVFFGSLDKKNANMSLSLTAFAESDYKVSADQLSALYVVADISDAFGLASASDVASNYVIATSMRSAGQTSVGKLEKPNITNLVVSRGVIKYTVQEGDTMENIAARYKVTTDQIRGSNSMKTTDISAGDFLFIPSVSGIVYTVKADDSIEDIVSRYGSSVAEIIALNDLETSGISEGMQILIKGGELPETERPEYVAPVTTVARYSYTYYGSSSSRENVVIIDDYFYDSNYPYPNPNPGVAGWCTWYAWWWRATNPLSLGELGHEGRNANTWNYNYAYRGVGSEPVVGAVFQTPYGGGGYGHVGVVIGVNGDGSILVREMNYYGRYVVTESTIPASQTGNFNYIY